MTHHPNTAETGWLHSVETGAAVDGPGLRFVYFMSGCLFRCLYCHNPDTWQPHGGRAVTLDEAVAEVAPYAGFLRMAGGVTVSGGEPLMQAPFVGALLRRLKDEFGLHTALDTQGYLGTKADDRWLDAVDLVLLDIKHADPEQYERITARPLQPTLDFAHRLVALGKPIWLRYVLVPGLTDAAPDVERLADIAASLGPVVQRVEVLPFHQMGAGKWRALGLDYRLADTPTPSPEQVQHARGIFAARGLLAT
ncbi:pyruvate formate-lyase-activating protein [Roseicella aquatilis]|uniref:Pyruvate formate-lyase-activating enzyme n=1 Tax=Roseicella aquatilis TaxID=2527868 RepID=A0A4R4DR87_9PROT|nr:pyruvate formate-lyase-activating protein [Roseicella aquatilis]TCZ64882.1 pyruvate formate lyase-activating protein [Roseicella aquatilis]